MTGHLSCNEATVKKNGTVCWHVLVWSVECTDQMVLNRMAAFFLPPSKSKMLLDLLHCLLKYVVISEFIACIFSETVSSERLLNVVCIA